jgi:hypothetical protein
MFRLAANTKRLKEHKFSTVVVFFHTFRSLCPSKWRIASPKLFVD